MKEENSSLTATDGQPERWRMQCNNIPLFSPHQTFHHTTQEVLRESGASLVKCESARGQFGVKHTHTHTQSMPHIFKVCVNGDQDRDWISEWASSSLKTITSCLWPAANHCVMIEWHNYSIKNQLKSSMTPKNVSDRQKHRQVCVHAVVSQWSIQTDLRSDVKAVERTWTDPEDAIISLCTFLKQFKLPSVIYSFTFTQLFTF